METLEITQEKALTPDHIVQVGSGFWASRTVLAAVKLELFTLLGDNFLSGENIGRHLNLHPRSLYDFLDALVSLGFLEREGIKETAVYANTPETTFYLNKNKPSYMGGILEMCNDRLYRFWADLDEALITGKPQNEAKYTGKSLFDAVYADPDRLKQFLNAMAGIQMGNFMALAKRFDFQDYNSLCDIGGASGMLAISVARQHPHLAITSADLPVVAPVAEENIKRHGLANQIQVANLDFMFDDFPKVDIITMGNILHDWDLKTKKLLIWKAYEALPPNGAFIVIENIIDDERRTNATGLLMSLNMLIETDGGFDYSFADFKEWVTEAGFRITAKLPLAGSTSAVIAFK
ncbi:methyltransferase [Adhaeribacter rhizoryzae]|uniref:Methyltransferase n=1 Tax=Adhaeribacter rhizoryzae TaxID=2607907 RepID=A0A5M6DL17_9BACT|nr:methyltransferase [Adhaeribacter rhizoryzae]KAA5548234.1 methyltransferase [Adhaeribacter rhizoryzae]